VCTLKRMEIISMQTTLTKLAQVAVSLAVLSAAFTLPAAAAVQYADGHGRGLHRIHHRTNDRPLTVTRRVYREPAVAAYDPFHGPASFITAPVAIAGTMASAPFRFVAQVFPPQGNPAANPLVLVGAPVHVVGQAVQFPFYAVDTAFGVPPNYY
jgi:hypothetical protein